MRARVLFQKTLLDVADGYGQQELPVQKKPPPLLLVCIAGGLTVLVLTELLSMNFFILLQAQVRPHLLYLLHHQQILRGMVAVRQQ